MLTYLFVERVQGKVRHHQMPLLPTVADYVLYVLRVAYDIGTYFYAAFLL